MPLAWIRHQHFIWHAVGRVKRRHSRVVAELLKCIGVPTGWSTCLKQLTPVITIVGPEADVSSDTVLVAALSVAG